MNHLRILFVIVLAVAGGSMASAEFDVRIGIVAYEDFHGELQQYERYFEELARLDPSVQFHLAAGSYSDVLHWIDQGFVDAAILTPGAFASVLAADGAGSSSATNPCEYLATIQIPAASSNFASPSRKTSGFHESYGSVALVKKSSSLHSIEALRKATASDRIEFLFVHPMSVSGRLIPLESLRQVGIDPAAEQVRFTYSHSQSLRLLAESDPTKDRIAFVWDDATALEPEIEAEIRQLPFPELAQHRIPQSVIVTRSGFEHRDHLQRLLTEVESDRHRFVKVDDWQSQFLALRDDLLSTQSLSLFSSGSQVSLDEISQALLHDSRSQPHPPRLALVLSGGGAKCSYQVGAVAALEAALGKLRDETGDERLDITLVVGTSGGAINSVPVAMGITSSRDGYQAFRETWLSLDQRDIVQPSWLIRANMGLWFAMLQVAIAIWFAGRSAAGKPPAGKRVAMTLLVFAAIEMLLAYIPINPWSLLGTNHMLHHIWLWMNLGIRPAAWMLLLVLTCMLLMGACRSPSTRRTKIPQWLTKTTLVAGIFGLPLIQFFTIAFQQQTLSTETGMEQTLAAKFPELIDRHLSMQSLSPLEPGGDEAPAKCLRNTSRQVVDRQLLKRDLVITGSCLSQTSDDLPSDLYFYASADPTTSPPPFGERGVSLVDRPETLFDVVMGSGSIFPVFPARRIRDVPRPGEEIELVDGGFAHNSPIEAAVLWGATHIILIEASPRSRTSRGNFLSNAASAFQHLYQQAQLVDTRSRGQVTIYSLAPTSPHLCVLDFANNLVAESIDRGYQDVAAGSRSFQKELGEPVFITFSSDQ